jgi:hypothetical protein
MSLTAGDLAELRALQAEWMTETVEHHRQPVTANAIGGRAATGGSSLLSSLKGRVVPAKPPQEDVLADRVRGKRYWKVTLPYDTVLRAEDWLLWGGRKLDLVGAPTAGSQTTALQVLCTEDTNG